MELASMLAGERFSDRPRSVCKTIAAFLRTYNDLIDDDRRQDLYEYAAKVVGTASPAHLQRLRAEHIRRWADQRRDQRRGAILTRACRRLGRTRTEISPESLARDAIRAAGRMCDDSHVALLSLVDELIAIGAASEVATPISASAMAPRERAQLSPSACS
jgi:hypothetical protein